MTGRGFDTVAHRSRLAAVYRAVVILVAALALAIGAAACGGDDEAESPTGETTSADGGGTRTDAAGPEPETEKVDRPAELPAEWTREINRDAGFSIGLPPGWTSNRTGGGQVSVLTSPDELITISVGADRTEGALQLPLDEFAIRTAEALGSEVVGADRFENLDVGEAAPFDHAYEAVGVRAIGDSQRTGVPERILVVVARREGQAAYVFVVRENADEPPEPETRDTIKEIIRSLRGRPPA